jgi:predicted RND superfamily exporter protein
MGLLEFIGNSLLSLFLILVSFVLLFGAIGLTATGNTIFGSIVGILFLVVLISGIYFGKKANRGNVETAVKLK